MKAILILVIAILSFFNSGFAQSESKPVLALVKRKPLYTRVYVNEDRYTVNAFRGILNDAHPSQEPLGNYQARKMQGWFYVLAGAAILGFSYWENQQTREVMIGPQTSPRYVTIKDPVFIGYPIIGGASVVIGTINLATAPAQLNRAIEFFNAAQWKKQNSRTR